MNREIRVVADNKKYYRTAKGRDFVILV